MSWGSDQQRAMEVTCARFNAANMRWRDGLLLRISVHRLNSSSYVVINVLVKPDAGRR